MKKHGFTIGLIRRGKSFIGLLRIADSGTPLEKAVARGIIETDVEDGGPGSGNYGHSGRPGQRGGSSKRGHSSYTSRSEESHVMVRGTLSERSSFLKDLAKKKGLNPAFSAPDFAGIPDDKRDSVQTLLEVMGGEDKILESGYEDMTEFYLNCKANALGIDTTEYEKAQEEERNARIEAAVEGLKNKFTQAKEKKFNDSAECKRPGCFDSDLQIMRRFGRIQGDHTWQDDVKKTNPGYVSGDWEHTNNCQRCVMAYEARRRGFDVEADVVMAESQTSSYNWWNCFGIRSSDVHHPGFDKKHKDMDPKTLKKRTDDVIRKMGSSARAVVSCDWNYSKKGEGHVFIAENHNGVIRYIDPQTGSEDASDNFDLMFPGTLSVARIDDKPFMPQAERWCVRP